MRSGVAVSASSRTRTRSSSSSGLPRVELSGVVAVFFFAVFLLLLVLVVTAAVPPYHRDLVVVYIFLSNTDGRDDNQREFLPAATRPQATPTGRKGSLCPVCYGAIERSIRSGIDDPFPTESPGELGDDCGVLRILFLVRIRQ